VFPARYELNSYIVFRKRLVSKRLREEHRQQEDEEYLWTGGQNNGRVENTA
jgi:hypothetical protein